MSTVKNLRDSGFKVRVTHLRLYDVMGDICLKSKFEKPKDGTLLTKGGKTIVEITLQDNTNLVGIAECSLEDGFNRKKGLNIALGRALKNKKQEN